MKPQIQFYDTTLDDSRFKEINNRYKTLRDESLDSLADNDLCTTNLPPTQQSKSNDRISSIDHIYYLSDLNNQKECYINKCITCDNCPIIAKNVDFTSKKNDSPNHTF